ncbi:helix-turn-helix transcriptional regulator [Xanthomonas campestris]|uniref:helix-turn-helix transcriptional regulator n=1 Tax=Xanthomonas campestris TaxID=339 RepID=UPI001E3D58D5|nr:AraC family transcriptional regulator [Xanthomonas campestris]MCC5087103.1 AraC family transcriptional regulator [Xanthomonas campestris]
MPNMARDKIREIHYQPAASYPYGLEIFRISDLRQRTSEEGMHGTYGYTFYMLILVTEGQCNQILDFEPWLGETGSLLMVRPGQAHNFGKSKDWDGWILLVRPDFLDPTSLRGDLRPAFDIARLPARIHINAKDLVRAEFTIQWMKQDAVFNEERNLAHPSYDSDRTSTFNEDVPSLLRFSFYAMISWLAITYQDDQLDDKKRRPALMRFHRFKELVEQNFLNHKSIGEYASEIGCTERSLTRATLDAEGISAKEYVSRRLGLEAKRLLLHTDWPIGIIADYLGFKEATHFSKFFKHIERCTPQQFRSKNGN